MGSARKTIIVEALIASSGPVAQRHCILFISTRCKTTALYGDMRLHAHHLDLLAFARNFSISLKIFACSNMLSSILDLMTLRAASHLSTEPTHLNTGRKATAKHPPPGAILGHSEIGKMFIFVRSFKILSLCQIPQPGLTKKGQGTPRAPSNCKFSSTSRCTLGFKGFVSVQPGGSPWSHSTACGVIILSLVVAVALQAFWYSSLK